MRRKKIIEAAVVCILLLLLGAYMEFSDRSMDDKNRIIRGSPGSGRQEVELTLNAGEQLKDYDYQISVPAQCIDEKTAQSYFSQQSSHENPFNGFTKALCLFVSGSSSPICPS